MIILRKKYVVFIVLSFILIFLFLIIVSNSSFITKKPYEQEETIWISEDAKSWFKVPGTGSSWCFGELTINEKKLPVCYRFGYDTEIAIFINDEDQVYKDDKNGGYKVVPDAECFYGTCTFKRKKVIIKFHHKDQKDNETIIFNKSKDRGRFLVLRCVKRNG